MILAVATVALLAAVPGAIQLAPDQVAWRPAPPTMPAGTQIARLEGDPQKQGLFTIRLKVPAGTKLAPHWHPRDERVTVLSGVVAVGFGSRIDETAVTRFGPGSFYVNPARSRHYLVFPHDAIVQITGEGPWEVHFLE